MVLQKQEMGKNCLGVKSYSSSFDYFVSTQYSRRLKQLTYKANSYMES